MIDSLTPTTLTAPDSAIESRQQVKNDFYTKAFDEINFGELQSNSPARHHYNYKIGQYWYTLKNDGYDDSLGLSSFDLVGEDRPDLQAVNERFTTIIDLVSEKYGRALSMHRTEQDALQGIMKDWEKESAFKSRTKPVKTPSDDGLNVTKYQWKKGDIVIELGYQIRYEREYRQPNSVSEIDEFTTQNDGKVVLHKVYKVFLGFTHNGILQESRQRSQRNTKANNLTEQSPF
ncbi:hypothetical protein GCM10023184_00100 [Flaviaesturariibacter amylovorans]|uniref:Uncharacterized protein n=1 Tax=Flaviaesturariibacter amylovorans TaxID=1084520 RepID=A0ABP8G3K7_9BACT